MFGKIFGPKRGGGNESVGNGGGMGEFDSQELQEAINEINEAQGQNTTELDAAMNGWEELAAMGRENSGAEAWSEGAMSADEAMGQSLQEAMACGMPVIASDIRGNRELIDRGKGGWLLHPKDKKGLVKVIQEVEKNNLARMGNYNCRKIEEYDKKIMIGEMKEIYDSIDKEIL